MQNTCSNSSGCWCLLKRTSRCHFSEVFLVLLGLERFWMCLCCRRAHWSGASAVLWVLPGLQVGFGGRGCAGAALCSQLCVVLGQLLFAGDSSTLYPCSLCPSPQGALGFAHGKWESKGSPACCLFNFFLVIFHTYNNYLGFFICFLHWMTSAYTQPLKLGCTAMPFYNCTFMQLKKKIAALFVLIWALTQSIQMTRDLWLLWEGFSFGNKLITAKTPKRRGGADKGSCKITTTDILITFFPGVVPWECCNRCLSGDSR